MQLSPDQVLLVGLIASVLTQVLKFAANKFGWKPSRIIVNVVLFAIAVVLAYFWSAPSLPPISDPAALAKALLEAALAVVGMASLIYNILLEKVVYPALRLSV